MSIRDFEVPVILVGCLINCLSLFLSIIFLYDRCALDNWNLSPQLMYSIFKINCFYHVIEVF